jgi:hypothetical protein
MSEIKDLKQHQQVDANTKQTEIKYIIPPGSQTDGKPIIIQTPGGTQTIPVPYFPGGNTPANNGPATGNTPANGPGNTPAANGPSNPVQPIEIVVKTTDNTVKSDTQTDQSTETKVDTNTNTKVDTKTDEHTTTDTKTDTHIDTKVSKETGGSGGKDPDGGRLGLGITSAGKPALTFDLAQPILGPKPLGLGKLGLGLFVTQTDNKKVGFGPQANYTKKYWFVGVGHELTEKKTLFMFGRKF